MRTSLAVIAVCAASFALCHSAVPNDELITSLQKADVELMSAGPLAFGPEGVLFIGDPRGAAIFAVATMDKPADPNKVEYNVEGLDKQIAAALGTEPGDILVADVAVNPINALAYVSVSRGRGPDAEALVLRVSPDGKITELPLKDALSAKADLPNPPADKETDRGNPRTLTITDLAFVDGRIVVAGLSNEEFASTLRSIPFPFAAADRGAGVEIFHGAHGKFETQSPVRTFTSYNIGADPHILAAYTCTPLVKFRLDELEPGAKVRGVTVAELGNRNQPLDMFVYNQNGKDYILLANSKRGVMKISTDDLDRTSGIEKKIDETAGQKYDTVEGWTGVVHLDRLNDNQALILSQVENGSLNLFSAPLP